MIVKWNGDGLNIVPAFDPAETDMAKVTASARIKLYPGYNEVPDETWNKCALHLNDMAENGKIEVLSLKDKDADGNDIYVGQPLKKFIPTRARVIVAECFNQASLELWLKEESRDEIRLAIKNQIDRCISGE